MRVIREPGECGSDSGAGVTVEGPSEEIGGANMKGRCSDV